MNDIMGEKTFNFVKFLLKSLVVLVSMLMIGLFIGILGELNNLNDVVRNIIIYLVGSCTLIYVLHTINVFKKFK